MIPHPLPAPRAAHEVYRLDWSAPPSLTHLPATVNHTGRAGEHEGPLLTGIMAVCE